MFYPILCSNLRLDFHALSWTGCKSIHRNSVCKLGILFGISWMKHLYSHSHQVTSGGWRKPENPEEKQACKSNLKSGLDYKTVELNRHPGKSFVLNYRKLTLRQNLNRCTWKSIAFQFIFTFLFCSRVTSCTGWIPNSSLLDTTHYIGCGSTLIIQKDADCEYIYISISDEDWALSQCYRCRSCLINSACIHLEVKQSVC